jgi:geranylgeranyl diphosphate synthase type II
MITFQDALEIINKKIQEITYSEPERLYKPISYLLTLKGKKIRPALTLLSCNLFRDDIDKAINTALSWEIFHNFTLMHDDVMDDADLRRGQPTVHKKWDENTAILSGDTMLILSYIYMAKSPEKQLKKLLDLFSTTAVQICSGQEYDMQFENRLDVSESEYIEMIYLKTAVLLGACLQSGAIIGGATEEDQKLLYDFGIHLGLAFQIQDDLLDVYGDSVVFGKKIGGDILCNKKTYLLINALNNSSGKDKEELLVWLNYSEKDEEKIKGITALYDKLQVEENAGKKKEYYYRRAIQALDAVNVAEDKKQVLRNLAEELMNRKK